MKKRLFVLTLFVLILALPVLAQDTEISSLSFGAVSVAAAIGIVLGAVEIAKAKLKIAGFLCVVASVVVAAALTAWNGLFQGFSLGLLTFFVQVVVGANIGFNAAKIFRPKTSTPKL